MTEIEKNEDVELSELHYLVLEFIAKWQDEHNKEPCPGEWLELLGQAYELGKAEASTVKLRAREIGFDGWCIYCGDVRLIEYFGKQDNAKDEAASLVKAVNPNAVIEWEDEDDRD